MKKKQPEIPANREEVANTAKNNVAKGATPRPLKRHRLVLLRIANGSATSIVYVAKQKWIKAI